MSLIKILDNFHRAILKNNPDDAMGDIKLSNRISAHTQLAIYIDGYRIRLLAAVKSDYPTLLGLLGDAEFERLALSYIENNPPSSFNLDRYPHNFANYIQDKTNDFAASLAKLESAIAEVFMLEGSAALTASYFSGMAEDEISNIKFKARPASKLLAFQYDVSGWLDGVRAGDIKPNDYSKQREDSYLYVYRHENEVKRSRLSYLEYLVLQEIFSGKILEEALEAVSGIKSENENIIAENIQEWFGKWVGSGFFAA